MVRFSLVRQSPKINQGLSCGTEHIKFLQCRCFGSDNTGLLPLETRFSRSSTLVSDLVRTGQQVPYYRQEAGPVDTDSTVISTASPQKFGLKN